MILDANVTVKWLIEEEFAEIARRLLTRSDLAAPELIDLEITSVLSRTARQRLLTADDASQLKIVHGRMPMARLEGRLLQPEGFELSIRLNAAFFDCVYLATALSRDDILVTADERFANVVRSDRRLAGTVRSLRDL